MLGSEASATIAVRNRKVERGTGASRLPFPPSYIAIPVPTRRSGASPAGRAIFSPTPPLLRRPLPVCLLAAAPGPPGPDGKRAALPGKARSDHGCLPPAGKLRSSALRLDLDREQIGRAHV